MIWDENNPVAYFHLFARPNYSIIYCLHTEPQSQPEQIIPFILERLPSRFPQPIYLLSLRHRIDFYRQFGFQPVTREEIPWELQMFLPQDFVILRLN